MATQYINLTKEQKNTLRTYVGMSLVISLVLSGAKVAIEDIELIPTLGIGSITTDVIFAGISEYISSSFEHMADKHAIPYAHSSNQGKITARIINLIPILAFVRFGIVNIMPAIVGRVKVENMPIYNAK